MQATLIAIGLSMAEKLLTQKFFTEIFLQLGEKFVKSTKTTVDDAMFEPIKRALQE